MNKKRIISVFMMMSLMLSLFAGCSDKEDNDSNKEKDTNSVSISVDVGESKITEITENNETTEEDVVYNPEEDADMTYIYAYDEHGKESEIAKLYSLSDRFVIDTEYDNYTGLVVDQVAKDLMKEKGFSYDEALGKIFNDKLMIYSAVDASKQQQIEDFYKNRLSFPDESGKVDAIQSSMVILDYEGRIVAAAGKLGENDGYDFDAFNRTRDPGSCIKPLSAYAPAIELGYYYWSSYLPNFGISVPGEEEAWPDNYGGISGDMSLYNLSEAIAPSLNTIPARIIDTIGVETSYEFVKDRFNITNLTKNDADYEPLVLGETENGMTVLQMAAAYATFGNGGIYYEPWAYYKVTDSSGKTILEPDRDGVRAISSGTADVMLQLLRCVVTSYNGTGKAYETENQWCWAKTGTTVDNCDKWFCGGTAYYVGCVWTGFEYEKEINTSLYGSNPAGKVYKEVMTRVHEGLEYMEFTMSENVVEAKYCKESGLIAGSSCTDTATGYYKKDDVPSDCSLCK